MDLRWLCLNYHSVKRINRWTGYHHTRSQRDARNTVRVVQYHHLATSQSTVTSTLFSFSILFVKFRTISHACYTIQKIHNSKLLHSYNRRKLTKPCVDHQDYLCIYLKHLLILLCYSSYFSQITKNTHSLLQSLECERQVQNSVNKWQSLQEGTVFFSPPWLWKHHWLHIFKKGKI